MKHALTALVAVLAVASALAAEDPPSMPRSEPYVPKAQRIPSQTPAAGGAELKAQAMRKLRLRFDQADADRNGALTQQEASAAGLGYVARNFDAIDQAHKGAVAFEDVQAYLRQRAAQARQRQ